MTKHSTHNSGDTSRSPMERWLDHLAEADAASASPDLESDLLNAARTQPSLRLAQSEPAQPWPERGALARIGPVRAWLAAAAAITLTAGALWLARPPAPATDGHDTELASLDAEVDSWLDALDTLDADRINELDLLAAETTALETTLGSAVRLPDLDGDTL